MRNCLFCQIINKQKTSNIIYEDDIVVAFNDIKPKAPIHILIIPKKHIKNINDTKDTDKIILGHMVLVAKKIAKDKNISQSGYRLIFNINQDAGQVVDHIHLHVLGGKNLKSI